MKKVLLGLVIAVMMTGSGYSKIYYNSDTGITSTEDARDLCIRAVKKGIKIRDIEFYKHMNTTTFPSSLYLFDGKTFEVDEDSCSIRRW